MNVGHQLGSSEYCTWVSTDNISDVDQLKCLIEYMEHHDCDFVHSDFTKIKKGKRSLIDMSKKKGRLGIGNIGPSFLYKRIVWDKFKYDIVKPEYSNILERLEDHTIRSFAAIMPNKKDYPTLDICSYKLVNSKWKKL